MLFGLEDPDCETLRVQVLKVFDGDGFLARASLLPGINAEIAVRCGFIDAPEMGQPGGQEAKVFLERQIGGQAVDLGVLTKMDTGGIVDRHRRIVAVPYLEQANPKDPWRTIWRNIELEMILNGWAWLLERYGPPDHYFDALEDARRHKRGIWVRDDNVHPWDFKKQAYRNKRPRPRTSIEQPELFSEAEHACPQQGCTGHLVRRSGKFGTFYGCSDFPRCRYANLTDRRDYYAVLGVAPGSEDVVIAAAYRALMRRYHPDTNNDASAQQKAREINEAYAVLGDAAKRAEYDRQRAARQTGSGQQQRNSGQGSHKAAGSKPKASAGPGPARPQQPPPPAGSSMTDGSTRWLIAAVIIGIFALPALLSGNSNQAGENTMNVDETLTTENVVANDITAIDASLDAAGNAVENAADALNSMEPETPPGLSKLPDEQVEYSNVERAAQKFAAILMKDEMAGARSFSDRCHKGVVAKPSWRAADFCAAFDFAAAHIDEAISKKGQFPANGYFQFQSDNQDDAYVAAGAYAYSLSSRLSTIRRAVEPAVVEALDILIARQRAREQANSAPASDDDVAADPARVD